jgi:membrane-bound lytic murein transglycosylase B
MNIQKIATNDATEYARAQMFYGDGAGIRRRIIEAKVSDLAEKDPKYLEAFERALSKQSWADHAAKAVKERKRIDRGKSLKRNSKAVLTGNHRAASSSLVAGIIIVGYVAHETGYDKKVLAEGLHQYRKGKAWARYKLAQLKAEHQTTADVHSVTNIN